MAAYREYSVTLTVMTDIENKDVTKAVLMAALDTAPTEPYFDCVSVEVVAEPFEDDECPDNGGPRSKCGHCTMEAALAS